MRKVDGVGIENGRLSFLSLPIVILDGADRVFREEEDHGNIDQGHRAHRDIRKIPEKIGGKSCADEDQKCGGDAVNEGKGLARLALQNIDQRAIYVIEVTEKGGEGEEDHRHGDKDRTEGAKCLPKALLNVSRA